MGAEGPPDTGFRASRSPAHADFPRRAALRPARCPLPVRRPHQRPMLPRPCRAAARSHPQAGRYRHPRQSRQPQVATAAPHDRGSRRQALGSAALFARPQPDRAGLRRDQAPDANRAEATRPGTWQHIVGFLATIESGERNNDFANSGYASVRTGNGQKGA